MNGTLTCDPLCLAHYQIAACKMGKLGLKIKITYTWQGRGRVQDIALEFKYKHIAIWQIQVQVQVQHFNRVLESKYKYFGSSTSTSTKYFHCTAHAKSKSGLFKQNKSWLYWIKKSDLISDLNSFLGDHKHRLKTINFQTKEQKLVKTNLSLIN